MAKTNDQQLLKTLQKLTPSQFEALLYQTGVPKEHLAQHTSQTEQAVLALQYLGTQADGIKRLRRELVKMGVMNASPVPARFIAAVVIAIGLAVSLGWYRFTGPAPQPVVSRPAPPPVVPQPVPPPALRVSDVDAVEEDTYIIHFAPPKKIHSVMLKNRGDEPLDFDIIGFPQAFFYNTLLDETSREIPAGADLKFRLVFMNSVPDRAEYPFELVYAGDKARFIIRIPREAWLSYFEEELKRLKHSVSHNPGPQDYYDAAGALLAKDYPDLAPGVKEALTGQLLERAQQPHAAALAYFNAEQNAPAAVERLVSAPPVIIALAQIYVADNRYSQAARWYDTAAKLGSPEAKHRLGKLYQAGQGVPQDLEKARGLFREAADEGYEEAWQELAVPEPAGAEDEVGAESGVSPDVIKFLRGKGNCPGCDLRGLVIRGASLPDGMVDGAWLPQITEQVFVSQKDSNFYLTTVKASHSLYRNK